MRVRRLTTGRVRGKRSSSGARRYLRGGWSDTTLPVHAFAVDHPAGVCLFDTGQTARATAGGYHQWWHPYLHLARFELEPADEVGAQLDPSSVRWVVLSHLHTDHVGGLRAFAHAEVLVAKAEWQRATGTSGKIRGYVPQHWPEGLEPVLVAFAGPPAGPFPASHDVAGDGSLLMVPLPGHTPGHAGLLVDGTLLLAGDASDTPAGLTALKAHDDAIAPEYSSAE